MKNKIPEKYKVRKPMSEKRKSLLKGLAFGFLAGGIATLLAVGVVGCAMRGGEAKEEPQISSIKGRFASVSDLQVGVTYQFVETPSSPAEATSYNYYAFEVAGVTYHRIWYGVESSLPKIGFATTANSSSYVWALAQGQWLAPEYRLIKFLDAVPSVNNKLGVWLRANLVEYVPPSSSSSESSSEATSAESTASESAVSTSEQTSEISPSTSDDTAPEESDRGIVVKFGDNPFTAWAQNPMTDDYATNFEGGVPWLLYTGKKSSDNPVNVTAKAYVFDVGEFRVYGNDSAVYDAIQITTLNLSTDNYFVDSSGTAVQIGDEQYSMGAFVISNIQYLNTVTDDYVVVWNIGEAVVTSGGNSVRALSSPRWVNDGFKTIVVNDASPEITIRNYPASVGWWLENNALNSSASVATLVLGDGSTGVFGLVASAFSAWGSIFGIAIIPGLTLGTLMFVPLVVLIIFAIIKLLNK